MEVRKGPAASIDR